MTAILAVAAVTLTASFVCSLFEAALYSISSAQIEIMRTSRIFGAERLAKLREKINDPIAAILTINTVAHTVGSAWCGALVGKYYGEYWVGVFAGVFTFLVLFATEIFPKNIGVMYALQIAPWMAWPLQIMVWAVWPIVKFCAGLVRLFGQEQEERAPTEDEIMMMSRLAVERGQLRPQELRWVENALRLDEVKASELMTPRTVVYTLPADMPLSDVRHRSEHWTHSRLPLTEDRDPDRIVGMVRRRDVFDAIVKGKPNMTLRDLMHEIDFVPDTMRGHQLLDLFIIQKKHIACVVDEYGGFEGVVTLEDVLECMIGSEIVDEYDRHADMQQLARQKAERRGRFPRAATQKSANPRTSPHSPASPQRNGPERSGPEQGRDGPSPAVT
ncbi:MAG: hemolysin family protein [Planctomycetota bacterium]